MNVIELAYDRYKALAEKQRFTASEKAEIEMRAAEFGITLDKKCPNCYHDAAVQIMLELKPKEKQQEGEYELFDDVDITIESSRFGTLRVNKANCTPANARKWREAGIPLRFFKRFPHEDNKQDEV